MSLLEILPLSCVCPVLVQADPFKRPREGGLTESWTFATSSARMMIRLKNLELRSGDGVLTERWSFVESVQLVWGACEWSFIRIHQEDTFEVQELLSELVRGTRVNCWISPKRCLWEDNWLIWSEEVVPVGRQQLSEIVRVSFECELWIFNLRKSDDRGQIIKSTRNDAFWKTGVWDSQRVSFEGMWLIVNYLS